MRRHLVAIGMATMMMFVFAVPTFAHGHGCRQQNPSPCSSICENVCQASCEDGVACGVDGHYCSEHRSGELCEGYAECVPAHREGHHHHRR